MFLKLRLLCRIRHLGIVGILTALPLTGAEALDVRWSAEAGAGYLHEVSDSIGVSPRAGITALLRLTESVRAGMLADYVPYNTKRPEDSGSHWRTLALIHWSGRPDFVPEWLTPFGQFGLGLGRVVYTDVRQLGPGVRAPQKQAEFGPAVRLAGGLETGIGHRMRAYAMVSLERMDTAMPGNGFDYPTMIAFTVGFGTAIP